MNRDIYQAITERFVEQLKRGTVPWRKPWSGVQNIVSRKPYRGINALLLGLSPYESPFWVSFKQALDLGGNVRKGEKSTPVIYYKFLEKRDGAGNLVVRSDGTQARVPFIRWSNVFNLDQTEGIKPPVQVLPESQQRPCDKAAALVESANVCPIRHVGFTAAYLPQLDEIHMPPPASFRCPEEYYHTVFHELTHATGHGSRLDREGVTNPVKFGSERYSREELIAELGAAFVSNEAGILNDVTFQNSAAYLASWAKKLEDDPRLIVSAASQAQRSSDFIMGIQPHEAVSENEPAFAVEETGDGLPAAFAPAVEAQPAFTVPVAKAGSAARTWPTKQPSGQSAWSRKGGISL